MSTINERVKMIRQSARLNEKEKMTMERFGKRLGVQKSAISNIENGSRGLTDQMFTSICREFSVNPDWLRNGSGEMFHEKALNEEIQEFIDDILVNEPEGIRARMVASLSRLGPDSWKMIEQVAHDLVEKQNKRDAEKAARERQELHDELDRQLDEEEGAAGKSGASVAI